MQSGASLSPQQMLHGSFLINKHDDYLRCFLALCSIQSNQVKIFSISSLQLCMFELVPAHCKQVFLVESFFMSQPFDRFEMTSMAETKWSVKKFIFILSAVLVCSLGYLTHSHQMQYLTFSALWCCVVSALWCCVVKHQFIQILKYCAQEIVLKNMCNIV